MSTDDPGVRYLFLKFTIVLVELTGALALLAGIVLVGMAFHSMDGDGAFRGAKLLLPDGRAVALADWPVVRVLTLAPGVGAVLLGILMLGVGQLCEVALNVETLLRKGPPAKK